MAPGSLGIWWNQELSNCFLVEALHRTVHTLKNVRGKFILPGSHIISDVWASFAGLDNRIVHVHNFVNPLDSDVHTQNVDNLWMRVKRKLREQFGMHDDLFTSRLQRISLVSKI